MIQKIVALDLNKFSQFTSIRDIIVTPNSIILRDNNSIHVENIPNLDDMLIVFKNKDVKTVFFTNLLVNNDDIEKIHQNMSVHSIIVKNEQGVVMDLASNKEDDTQFKFSRTPSMGLVTLNSQTDYLEFITELLYMAIPEQLFIETPQLGEFDKTSNASYLLTHFVGLTPKFEKQDRSTLALIRQQNTEYFTIDYYTHSQNDSTSALEELPLNNSSESEKIDSRESITPEITNLEKPETLPTSPEQTQNSNNVLLKVNPTGEVNIKSTDIPKEKTYQDFLNEALENHSAEYNEEMMDDFDDFIVENGVYGRYLTLGDIAEMDTDDLDIDLEPYIDDCGNIDENDYDKKLFVPYQEDGESFMDEYEEPHEYEKIEAYKRWFINIEAEAKRNYTEYIKNTRGDGSGLSLSQRYTLAINKVFADTTHVSKNMEHFDLIRDIMDNICLKCKCNNLDWRLQPVQTDKKANYIGYKETNTTIVFTIRIGESIPALIQYMDNPKQLELDALVKSCSCGMMYYDSLLPVSITKKVSLGQTYDFTVLKDPNYLIQTMFTFEDMVNKSGPFIDFATLPEFEGYGAFTEDTLGNPEILKHICYAVTSTGFVFKDFSGVDNYHHLFSGGTGSGKSSLMNTTLLQLFSSGMYTAIVLDAKAIFDKTYTPFGYAGTGGIEEVANFINNVLSPLFEDWVTLVSLGGANIRSFGKTFGINMFRVVVAFDEYENFRRTILDTYKGNSKEIQAKKKKFFGALGVIDRIAKVGRSYGWCLFIGAQTPSTDAMDSSFRKQMGSIFIGAKCETFIKKLGITTNVQTGFLNNKGCFVSTTSDQQLKGIYVDDEYPAIDGTNGINYYMNILQQNGLIISSKEIIESGLRSFVMKKYGIVIPEFEEKLLQDPDDEDYEDDDFSNENKPSKRPKVKEEDVITADGKLKTVDSDTFVAPTQTSTTPSQPVQPIQSVSSMNMQSANLPIEKESENTDSLFNINVANPTTQSTNTHVQQVPQSQQTQHKTPKIPQGTNMHPLQSKVIPMTPNVGSQKRTLDAKYTKEYLDACSRNLKDLSELMSPNMTFEEDHQGRETILGGVLRTETYDAVENNYALPFPDSLAIVRGIFKFCNRHKSMKWLPRAFNANLDFNNYVKRKITNKFMCTVLHRFGSWDFITRVDIIDGLISVNYSQVLYEGVPDINHFDLTQLENFERMEVFNTDNPLIIKQLMATYECQKLDDLFKHFQSLKQICCMGYTFHNANYKITNYTDNILDLRKKQSKVSIQQDIS